MAFTLAKRKLYSASNEERLNTCYSIKTFVTSVEIEVSDKIDRKVKPKFEQNEKVLTSTINFAVFFLNIAKYKPYFIHCTVEKIN